MSGATSVMSVIRGAFSQWADTIDWTVRCDWLQVAIVVTCSLQVLTFILFIYYEVVFKVKKRKNKFNPGSFIVVVIAFLRSDHK